MVGRCRVCGGNASHLWTSLSLTTRACVVPRTWWNQCELVVSRLLVARTGMRSCMSARMRRCMDVCTCARDMFAYTCECVNSVRPSMLARVVPTHLSEALVTIRYKDARGFSAVHLSALLETEDEQPQPPAAPEGGDGEAWAGADSPLSPARRASVSRGAAHESSNAIVSAVAEQRDRYGLCLECVVGVLF